MYWSIKKTLINGKKAPLISPLFVNNNLISNFREKDNFFNDFVVQQCQPIANNSILSVKQIFYTKNSLRYFDSYCRKILKLLNGLNPHKANGHDGISLRMLKLCNLTITKPLLIIYQNFLQQGVFRMSATKVT